ncbi:hypothetical protein [Piscinibacter koreensis]|uniref:Uncharacterized protein n=1 Tax=Piscinibacter koreensis TaxID=2742824 RepID=A0A7Y6NL83_9BURK|nr:hypothetical protein [Schlegelella koreensis]NUZ05169.1 hypothetical protein [Schlegelella koreensis]
MDLDSRRIALTSLEALTCLFVAACGGGGGSPSNVDNGPVASVAPAPGPTDPTISDTILATRPPRPEPAPAPAPAPAPSPTPAAPISLSFGLTSSVGGSALPFTLGQALRQGDVPSGKILTASGAESQFVVKNRWPDGSAKYAVISGRADLTANSPKTIALSVAAEPAATAALSSADLKTTGITASIQYGSFGTANWTTTDWDKPEQAVVSGPQMSAWTFRKPIGNDPHLVGWLEVRAYKGGRVEVLPWVENGYLRVAAPTNKAGTVTFTLGGMPRFSQALNLLNHQRAVLASGTALTHWFGNDPKVTPRHDTAYLMATKLVPNYRANTPANSALFSRLAQAYTPLERSNLPVAMGDTGYDASIGLLPEWDVVYLTSGGDPRAWNAVIINGYAAGRYGTHFRDETTNRVPRISAYPNLVSEGSNGVNGTGTSTKGTYTPTATGGMPPTFGSSHQPSMGYMAYVISGWNYFIEEAQQVAFSNYLKNGDNTRFYAQGVFETSAGANTTRGAAWAIRTLAQATVLTPDADPLRNEFVSSLSDNVSYYYNRYIAVPSNPLGLVQPYANYGSGDPLVSATWQDDFFTATFGYIKDLAAHKDSVQTQLDGFLSWKYRSVVGRLGTGAASDWSYRYGAQYTTPYAPKANTDWWGGTGPWYASWGEMARAVGVPMSGNPGDSLESGYPVLGTGYWGNLMPALAYAVDHNAAGAVAAWQRVTSASNWPQQAADYDVNPVWGVKPRVEPPPSSVITTPTPTPTPAPAPSPIPVVTGPQSAGTIPGTPAAGPATSPAAPAAIASLGAGKWMELPNTKIRSVLPSTPQRGYPSAIVDTWNGGTVDTARSRLLVWGGGHSDYYGNEMYALDLPTLSIKRIVEPSPKTGQSNCTSALSDGTPTSRHTYDGLTYLAHADRFFAVNGSLAPCGGVSDAATWTYDYKTNAWIMMLARSLPDGFGTMAVYDAATKQVFVKDTAAFYAYSLETNSYRKLADHAVDYHLSAAIDTKRRKFVMLGNGVQVIDLSTNEMTTLQTTNAPGLVSWKQSPGVAYDPVADRIVAWHGGSEVWALDMDTLVWTQVATGPGPTSAAPYQGTFGRWGYIPQYNVFAMINSIDENAWVFRLSK